MTVGGLKSTGTEYIGLGECLSNLSKPEREKLLSGYDMMSFAKIFEDSELMGAVETFLSSGMNVSLASRILYMHRNTLIYKLNAVKRTTGLDLHDFRAAVTFEILHTLYEMK